MVNTNADLSDMAVKTAICIYSKVHIFCGINPDSQQIFVISDFQIDTNKKNVKFVFLFFFKLFKSLGRKVCETRK